MAAVQDLRERLEHVDFQEDILLGLEGMDAQEVADAVGLSRKYVYNILRGDRVPSLEHWEALAERAG